MKTLHAFLARVEVFRELSVYKFNLCLAAQRAVTDLTPIVFGPKLGSTLFVTYAFFINVMYS